MSFQYNGFTVGDRVKVTVEFPPNGGNGLRRTVSTFAGTVTMPIKDDHNNTVRMTTGNEWTPERVIPIDKIVGRRRVTKKLNLSKNEWKVKSKSRKGKFHTISLKGQFWSCTCESFQYRRFCQHIKEKQKETQ